jgi:asparagine synthase (glutamine-hydrolysing)
MCGICGVFETAGGRVSRTALRRMTDALAHRGPDADGYLLAEHGGAAAELAEAPVALGHRRLKIIDLSDSANQPMLFEGGRLAVVFNGEIFNYRELLAEHFSDRRPLTTSDTEVIGWAYRKWGLDCFRRFNGFFAIAIYDADRDLLVLARDRMGKKPLFYYQQQGHFAFGSELKALFAYPHLTRSLDEEALLAYLTFLYVPGDGCILQHCRKLPAGSYLTIDGKGEVHTERYYDVLAAPAHPTTPPRSLEESEDELDRLLTDATRLRLISDVPLGAFLSGGIDSSTIVAYMCRAGTTRPRTFTIAYEDPKFNEGPFAAAVAKHLGTDHTELVAQPDDALALIERMPQIYDEPFADPSALPTTLLSELTRRHVTVALSGDGGDELFFGYDRYKRALEFARWTWIPQVLRSSLAHMLFQFGPRGVKQGRRIEQPDFASYFLLRSCVFNRYDLPRLTGQPFPDDNELTRVLRRLDDVPLHRRMRAAEARVYLCDDILQKVDRASMSCALETRAPLLDHRVVEFALGLPQDLVLRGRTRKYLLKKLLYKHVPEEIFRRPKMGFRIPLGSWFRGKLRPMLDQYLEPERLRKQGLLRPEFVTQLVNNHVAGKLDAAHPLFSLLVFQMWYDTYLS